MLDRDIQTEIQPTALEIEFVNRLNNDDGKVVEKIGNLVTDLDDEMAVHMKAGDFLALCALQNLQFQVSAGSNIEGIFGDAENDRGEDVFKISPVAVLRIVDSEAGRKVVNDVIQGAKEKVVKSRLNGYTGKILDLLNYLGQPETLNIILDQPSDGSKSLDRLSHQLKPPTVEISP